MTRRTPAMTSTKDVVESKYQCPVSREPLALHEDQLVARSGRPAYRIIDKVAVFQSRDFVEPDVRDRLDALNRRAALVGWRRAIAEPDAVGPGSESYITDETRHPYVDILSLGAKDDVLEIGCSMGQCSVGLARRAGSLHVLDIVRGQAQFALLRCHQEGHHQVHAACGGEDSALPYRNESFDVVVLNLVLEWCAGRTSGEHEARQRNMLSEIARVLRPTGRAWISTKNRFSLRLLCGGRDEHMAQLRFGSSLPRWLGQKLLRQRGVERSDGRLHSHRHLRTMILESGFSSATSYWALPDARHPVRIVQADPTSVRQARREHPSQQAPGRWVSQLMRLVPASLVKHLAAGNSFIAIK